MATCRQRGNVWEFVVKCKAVRLKPFYFTFDDRDEGERYCAKLEAMLRQGIIPPEVVHETREHTTIGSVIDAYNKGHVLSNDDESKMPVLLGRIGKTSLAEVNYRWCEQWILGMKHERQMSPSTIRHYVGALARCFDWASNYGVVELAVNPLRRLPRGYASYTKLDAKVVGRTIANNERDRRLESGEEHRIRQVLAGFKPEEKQRALTIPEQRAIACVFELALETAMRMREIYTLERSQIKLDQRTIFLEKTKNGSKRQVPMSSVVVTLMTDYLREASPSRRIFPWWDGEQTQLSLRRTTAKVSQQFARIFEHAGCPDLHFHDLRHEATSRLFERTQLSDAEIMKITGHKGLRMLMRYANLRATDLAAKMW